MRASAPATVPGCAPGQPPPLRPHGRAVAGRRPCQHAASRSPPRPRLPAVARLRTRAGRRSLACHAACLDHQLRLEPADVAQRGALELGGHGRAGLDLRQGGTQPQLARPRIGIRKREKDGAKRVSSRSSRPARRDERLERSSRTPASPTPRASAEAGCQHAATGAQGPRVASFPRSGVLVCRRLAASDRRERRRRRVLWRPAGLCSRVPFDRAGRRPSAGIRRLLRPAAGVSRRSKPAGPAARVQVSLQARLGNRAGAFGIERI